MGSVINTLMGNEDINNITRAAALFDTLDASQQKLVLSSKLLDAEKKSLLLSTAAVTASTEGDILATSGLTVAEAQNTIATDANTGAKITNQGVTVTLSNLHTALAAKMGISTAAAATLTAALTAGIVVVAGAAIAYKQYQQQRQESIDAANDSLQALRSEQESINDTAEKYKTLYKELTAANTTEERQFEIKSELLKLQTELNDKYGEEHGKIDLVTNAYANQLGVITQLNKQLAENWLNSKEDDINTAKDEYYKKRTFALHGYNRNNDDGKMVDEIVSKYRKKGLRTESTAVEGYYKLYLDADVENAEEIINDFMTEVRAVKKEFESENIGTSIDMTGILKGGSAGLDVVKEVMGNTKDIVEDEKLYIVMTTSSLAEDYNLAAEAVTRYNTALTSGTKEDITGAHDNLREVRNSIDLTEGKWRGYESVIEGVFDKASSQIHDFQYALKNPSAAIANIDLSANTNMIDRVGSIVGNYKRNLSASSLTDVFGKKSTTELKLLAEDPNSKNAFKDLIELGKEYGLTIDDVIFALEDMGIKQKEIGKLGDSDVEDYFASIEDLGDASSITADRVVELAEENEVLAHLLYETGASAEYLATALQKTANGENGFASLTESGILLSKVLGGLDNEMHGVAKAKDKLNKVLGEDDYNDSYVDSTEKFKTLQENLKKGDFGKHTEGLLEYFFGDRSYDMDLDAARAEVKKFQSLWSDPDNNGAAIMNPLLDLQKSGVLEKLNSSAQLLSDGSFELNLDPTQYEEVAKAIGISKEAFLEFLEASKINGSTVKYNVEELAEAFKLVGFSMEDLDGKSVMSMQTLERYLEELGFSGKQIHQILGEVAEMDTTVLIDFETSGNEERIRANMEKLKELGLIKIDAETGNIDIDNLIKGLMEDFGQSKEDVQTALTEMLMLEGVSFQTADLVPINDLTEALGRIESLEIDTEKAGLLKITEEADDAKVSVDTLTDAISEAGKLELTKTRDSLEGVGTDANGAKKKVDDLATAIKALPSVLADIHVNATAKVTGDSEGIGEESAAGAYGTAYANGNSGIKNRKALKKVLVGELGQETIVDPHSGTYHTVGDNGAEFIDKPKDAIIFNHKQTEQLQRNGKIGSRGKAFAKGNAFANGLNYGWTKENVDRVNNANSSKSKSKSKSDKDKETEIDWIERLLEILKDQRDELEKDASNAAMSYLGLTQEEFDRAKELIEANGSTITTDMVELQEIAKNAGMSMADLFAMIYNGENYSESRRSALAQIIEADKIHLETYMTAIEEYQRKYEELVNKLAPEIRDKIENGSIEISSYSGDEAKDIEAAISAHDKLKDTVKEKNDLEAEAAENIKNYYDNNIEYLDKQADRITSTNAKIDAQNQLLVAQGKIVSSQSYEQVIANNKKLIALYEQKIKEAKKKLAELGASPDDEDYHDIMSDIEGWEEDMAGLDLAIAEVEDQLLNLPIENMEVILNMINSITDTMERWGSEMEASGKKLDREYYQMLIDNGMKVIDQYKEQIGLIQDVMDEYDEGSENWNKLYDKMQSINAEMSAMIENLHKWNEAMLQIPLDTVNDYSSALQKALDAMSKVQSEYESVISTVTNAIQEQIDLLEEERDLEKEKNQAQIDVLNERLELLNKQNEALQLQTAYEQALYDLHSANTQKTERVIREGTVVYENNAENLRNAQESLQDALANLEKHNLQQQIDGLQDELDAVNDRYEEQIDSLEKISEKWSEIADKIEQAKNEAATSDILGEGWKDKVLSGKDDDIYDMFSGMYQTLSDQMTQYEDQIESTENIYNLLNDYIAAYKEGTITYDQAVAGINDLLSQMNQKMSGMDNLNNVFDFLSASTGAEANADSILTTVQDALITAGEELIDSFRQYNENAGLISEYMTSWEQLTTDVNDIKYILEDVRDNLEDALDEMNSRRSSDDDDDDDDSPWGNWGGSLNDIFSGYGNDSIPIENDLYADGIENGLVGTGNETKRERLLRLFSSQPIEDINNAVPIIAHRGEAVLNDDQQAMLLKNLSAAAAPISHFIPPTFDQGQLSTRGSGDSTTFTFGDIKIERCDNPDQLAEGILKGGLRAAVMQQIGKPTSRHR